MKFHSIVSMGIVLAFGLALNTTAATHSRHQGAEPRKKQLEAKHNVKQITKTLTGKAGSHQKPVQSIFPPPKDTPHKIPPRPGFNQEILQVYKPEKELRAFFPLVISPQKHLYEAGIIVHVDHRVFTHLAAAFGSVQARVDHIKSQVRDMFASVAVVYRRELGIALNVDEVIVETNVEHSPFRAVGFNARFQQVRNHWNRRLELNSRDRTAVLFFFGYDRAELNIEGADDVDTVLGRAAGTGHLCSKALASTYFTLNPLESGQLDPAWPGIHAFEDPGSMLMQESALDGSPYDFFFSNGVLAHELGHVFGGQHLWELENTPSEDILLQPGIMGTGPQIGKPMVIHAMNQGFIQEAVLDARRLYAENPRCLKKVNDIEPVVNAILLPNEIFAGNEFELDADIDLSGALEGDLDFIWHLVPAEDFLDGLVELPIGPSDNKNRVYGRHATVRYERAGAYPPIGLYVAHSWGAVDYAITPADIRVISNPQEPAPIFDSSPVFLDADGLEGSLEQHFHISFWDAAQRNLKVSWNFGDGSEPVIEWISPDSGLSDSEMTHRYSSSGEYEISVRVDYGDGVYEREDVYLVE